MNPAEVVVHVEQGYRVNMVLKFLGEAIGQSGEPAHTHPHVEILPFDIGRAHVSRIGIASDRLQLAACTDRGAVPLLRLLEWPQACWQCALACGRVAVCRSRFWCWQGGFLINGVALSYHGFGLTPAREPLC